MCEIDATFEYDANYDPIKLIGKGLSVHAWVDKYIDAYNNYFGNRNKGIINGEITNWMNAFAVDAMREKLKKDSIVSFLKLRIRIIKLAFYKNNKLSRLWDFCYNLKYFFVSKFINIFNIKIFCYLNVHVDNFYFIKFFLSEKSMTKYILKKTDKIGCYKFFKNDCVDNKLHCHIYTIISRYW